MRRPGIISPVWQARLAAWPGLLTLLSVLAVVLGTPAPAPDSAPRLSASTVAPAVPELRAAPQPAPAMPLLTPPAPVPYRVAGPVQNGSSVWWHWVDAAQSIDLTTLGRQQTDGG